MKYLWLGAAALFVVAAVALWWNISNPAWAYGFVAAAVASLLNHFVPKLLKRMSPEDEAEWRNLVLRGASEKEIQAWQKARMRKNRQS